MTKKKDSADKAIRDIRRATRRQYSAEEKIRIVLEGLRGESSIAERTREITQAIRETGRNSQQAGQDAEARQREHLTRFLGVWQMSGWVQEPGQGKVNVSAQVNGTVQMNYFVEMAYIDLKAGGFDDQIWGTSTFGYDADNGFELSTRFNTLSDSIDVAGGSTVESYTFTRS